ncbi:Peroxisomal 2,4-dienoyl-CoA reductase [Tyrophagus putrescentiae]|nr:Peroxisomal 2,4-dienoyl-CoA reductase [Tyrophagus putrescentiae]
MSSKYNFSGKVALVTGSSTGIGAGVAIQLAKYGAQVAITGRNAVALGKVADQVAAVAKGGERPLEIVADLLDDSTPKKLIEETVAKFGKLDILINNAGGASPNGRLSSPTLLSEFDAVFKLNVRSVVELTQLAVPYLEKTAGNVVNISSIAGIRPGMLVYSASKAALDMITKTSALELGPKQIRVNSVNPGPVVTEFLRSVGFDDAAKQKKFYDQFTENSLMKRIGDVDDIANLVSFVASDDARNITGSILVSDSGFLISGTRPNFSNDDSKKE